jgi:hypothetical protein
MVHYIISFVILIHGLIHFMGFAKAFGNGDMKQLTIPISKPAGLMWMLTALLFIATFILYLLENEYWGMMAIAAIMLSQLLITMNWRDAKFGTIVNIVILVVYILSKINSHLEI